jgi:hypothetical protein
LPPEPLLALGVALPAFASQMRRCHPVTRSRPRRRHPA